MKKDILIMVAALNEDKSIGHVVIEAKEKIKNADILVVDGYSRDKTVEVAIANGATVIQMAKSFGIGGAVEAGILYAYRHGYNYFVRIDADGQHRPAEIINMLNAIENNTADFVIGSRFLGNSNYRPNFLRHFSIFLISALVHLLYKIKIYDCTSGCQLYNRALIEFFARDIRFEYSEVRAIWTAHKAGFKIEEVFLNMAPRTHGVSSFSTLNAFLYMFKNIVDIIFSPPVFIRRHKR